MKKGDDLKNVFMSRAHRRDIQYHSFTLFIDFMFSFALECLVVLFIGTHGQASYREDVHATLECAMRQNRLFVFVWLLNILYNITYCSSNYANALVRCCGL